MDDFNQDAQKSHYISNDYFKPRQDQNTPIYKTENAGSIGGEISSAEVSSEVGFLGYGNLESAVEHIHSLKNAQYGEWDALKNAGEQAESSEE